LDRHDGAAVDSGRSQEPVVLRADTLRLRYVALSGAVPQLAIRVDAPGPEAAILLDGDGVVRTARSEDPAAAGDLGRHFLHRRVSPAELAEPVPPPRPEGPVRLDGQREVVAGTDGHPVVVGAYALERLVPFARDPELAVAVVTGDPERAVGLECDALSVASRDRHPGRPGGAADGRVPIRGVAEAELPVFVPAPAPEGAVVGDGQAVGPGPCHGARLEHAHDQLRGPRQAAGDAADGQPVVADVDVLAEREKDFGVR